MFMLHRYICIYIYIERERYIDRYRCIIPTYIYIYIIHMCIYIYTCIARERGLHAQLRRRDGEAAGRRVLREML